MKTLIITKHFIVTLLLLSTLNMAQANCTTTETTSTVLPNYEEADLHVQNSVQPMVTELGGAVTFIIAVNNKGPATSNDIVSKVVFPSSYSITNVSVTHGNYNQTTKLWNVGTLDAWKRAVMTVMVIVLNDTDLMTTAELIKCSTTDPDSTPNNGIDTNGNGLIIDDEGDEDDGDGQDVKISDLHRSSNNEIANNRSKKITPNEFSFDTDVKMVMEHKKDKIISFLDFDTMAMRMEYHSKGKNPDPVYWDKDGYIYSGEKGNYYKIPFDEVKNMGKNIVKMFSMGNEDMLGDHNVEWPSEPIIYNGYELHVYPNRYPMVEWVFVYHPDVFRGAENITEEKVDCRGDGGCSKFTLTKGEGAGSTVLFDTQNRLAEITNPDGASMIYTYERCSVTLPQAQSFNFNFKN